MKIPAYIGIWHGGIIVWQQQHQRNRKICIWHNGVSWRAAAKYRSMAKHIESENRNGGGIEA